MPIESIVTSLLITTGMVKFLKTLDIVLIVKNSSVQGSGGLSKWSVKMCPPKKKEKTIEIANIICQMAKSQAAELCCHDEVHIICWGQFLVFTYKSWSDICQQRIKMFLH